MFPDDPKPKSSVFKQGPLIWKPSDGAQGDGIVLINSADGNFIRFVVACEISNASDRLLVVTELTRRLSDPRSLDSVLQRYLAKPLLLNGLKFDIRCYVLIVSSPAMRRCL